MDGQQPSEHGCKVETSWGKTNRKWLFTNVSKCCCVLRAGGANRLYYLLSCITLAERAFCPGFGLEALMQGNCTAKISPVWSFLVPGNAYVPATSSALPGVT